MGKSRRLVPVFLLLLAGIVSYSSASSKARGLNPRVLMISIDGFRPDFYRSEEFNSPTLKELVRKGASADGSVPVFPSVTYPNHTSLITGTSPEQHGILSNTLFDWEKGPQPAWYWEAHHVKSPTILELAQTRGLETSAVRWPVTLFGTATYLVPEIFGMPGYYEGDGYELTVKYTKKELMDDIAANISQQGYKSEEEMDHWVASASAHIWKKNAPSLMVVHLANVDHVEHGTGRDSDETKAAVFDANNNIKTILQAVDLVNTCVMIVGDHGFYDVSKSINLNVLFLEKGWITADETGKIESWKVVAHSSGGQAAIYSKDKSLRAEVLKLLEDNQVLGYRLIKKAQLNSLGSYPDAIAAITAKEGFTCGNTAKGEIIAGTSVKGQHGALPDDSKLHTGFIAVGCGIKGGQNLGVISNLNVAPTIAKWLGVPMPSAEQRSLRIVRDGRKN